MKANTFKLIVLNCLFCITQTMANSQNTDSLISNIKFNPNKNLNMLAIGYQIGGITFAGVDYEYRFSKHIGFNSGIGIKGFNLGLKFHACPCRTGPFLNISFKDGNFGELGTINAEMGGVLIFFDKYEKLGLLAQIGLGKIVYLSNDYYRKFQTNDIILTLGIGISWYLYK